MAKIVWHQIPHERGISVSEGHVKKYRVRLKSSRGRRYPVRTFPNLGSAKKYRNALLAERQGLIDAPRRITPLTVREYFLESWSRVHRINVSEGWRITQDQLFRDHVDPVIGHLNLADVVPLRINELMVNLESKGLGGQSRMHVLNLVRKIFSAAVSEGLTVQNPVQQNHNPKVRPRKRDLLNSPQIRQLLVTVKDDYLEPALLLGFLAGLRYEAIAALEWSDIDFENLHLVIKRGYKRKVKRIEQYQKSGRPQIVPMIQYLADRLKWWHDLNNGIGFVAAGEKGKLLPYGTLYHGLEVRCRQAGVPKIVPHEMRHSCAALMTEHGANIEDIRQFLGHTQASTTHRYLHRSDDRLAGLAASIDLGIGPNISGSPPLKCIKGHLGIGFDGQSGKSGDTLGTPMAKFPVLIPAP